MLEGKVFGVSQIGKHMLVVEFGFAQNLSLSKLSVMEVIVALRLQYPVKCSLLFSRRFGKKRFKFCLLLCVWFCKYFYQENCTFIRLGGGQNENLTMLKFCAWLSK